MIKNPCIRDARTVTAYGPRFDTRRVYEATVRFLRDMSMELSKTHRGLVPIWRLLTSGDIPLDESGYERLYECHLREGESYDVVESLIKVVIGPFWIMLKLRGASQLYLDQHSPQEPTTSCQESWLELDPTPTISILSRERLDDLAAGDEGENMLDRIRSGLNRALEGVVEQLLSMPEMDPDLQAIIRRHAPKGTNFVAGRHVELFFPHDVFGAGEGDLRIALQYMPGSTQA